MDATAHLVVGAALTRRMSPPLGFVVGLASHAVLDAIPHYNYTGWRPFSPIMVVDVAIGVSLALAIALMAPRPWGALAGSAGGIFPEVERALTGHRYDLFQRLFGFPNSDTGLPWGLVTQIAVTVIALAIGLRVQRRRAGSGAISGAIEGGGPPGR